MIIVTYSFTLPKSGWHKNICCLCEIYVNTCSTIFSMTFDYIQLYNLSMKNTQNQIQPGTIQYTCESFSFLSKIAFHILSFCILGFSQLQIKNTPTSPTLGWGCSSVEECLPTYYIQGLTFATQRYKTFFLVIFS